MKKTLLVFLFLFSIVCFTNIQTSAASTVAKGKCGKNATWILSEDGVMHIKGKGILKGEKNGWNKYQYKIKKIFFYFFIEKLPISFLKYCFERV